MVDRTKLQAACRLILDAIGENAGRDGLLDTPRRFADAWAEFIDYEPGRTETTFESAETDQMVVISGIRVWSLCEHHLLPFSSTVSIGYMATDKVLGLSKFGRIAHEAAHRLQLQERMSQQIADRVAELTGSPDVAVVCRGEHLCMSMRGIRTPAIMVSSVARGLFRDVPSARAEFLSLAGSSD